MRYLCLTYFTSFMFHPFCYKTAGFLSFYGWIIFHCVCVCIHPTIHMFMFTCNNLFIHPSADLWVVSVSWLLWIMLQWKWGCRYHFKVVIPFPSKYTSRSGAAGSYGGSTFNFFRTFHNVSTAAAPAYIRTNSAGGFPFSLSTPTLVITCLIATILTGVGWYLAVIKWTIFELNLSPFPVCQPHNGRTCNRIRHTIFPRKHAYFGHQVIPTGKQSKVENTELYLNLECTVGLSYVPLFPYTLFLVKLPLF